MGTFAFNQAPRWIAAGTLAGLLVACSPIVTQRGNLPDPDLLSQLEPGEQSRRDVANLLGSPTSFNSFGDETWYYISSQIETIAFYEPDVTEQQVVAITFGEDGILAKVRTYGLDDARDIELVQRVTPTGGRKLTFLEQLVGNVGRFVTRSDQPGKGGGP